MTLEEYVSQIKNLNSDLYEEFVKSITPKDNPPPSSEPPSPKPREEIKADTQITMTAAEFMRLLEDTKSSKKLDDKKEEKKEDSVNGEIFI